MQDEKRGWTLQDWTQELVSLIGHILMLRISNMYFCVQSWVWLI